MHVVCKAHGKRSLFFQFKGNSRKSGGLVVLHRSGGERCSLPLMAGGKEVSSSDIQRIASRDD